jgi:hypothetical protein
MAEDKKMTTFRLSAQARQRLEALAEIWHCDMVAVVEHAIHLLSEPDLQASVGDAFQSAELGLRCWAALLDQAAVENGKTFSRAEFNLIADSNNGSSPSLLMTGEEFRASFGPTLLWANVADDIALNGADQKWLGQGAEAKQRGKKLIEKLRALDYVHGWALIVAVQWFWAHCQQVDHLQQDWWLPAERLRLAAGAI